MDIAVANPTDNKIKSIEFLREGGSRGVGTQGALRKLRE